MTIHGRGAPTIRVSSLALAAGIVCWSATIGSARDFCINYNGGVCNYVGKSFKVPDKGKCRPWSGFGTPACFGAHNAQTGTACTASDGTHVNFTITSLATTGVLEFTSADLPLPALTGGSGVVCNLSGCFPLSVDSVPCAPSKVPIP